MSDEPAPCESVPLAALLAIDPYSLAIVQAVVRGGGRATWQTVNLSICGRRYPRRLASPEGLARGIESALAAGLVVEVARGPRTEGPTFGAGPALGGK